MPGVAKVGVKSNVLALNAFQCRLVIRRGVGWTPEQHELERLEFHTGIVYEVGASMLWRIRGTRAGSPASPTSLGGERACGYDEGRNMSSHSESMNRCTAGVGHAIELALKAHRGQEYPAAKREPYALHLFRVMLAVDSSPARMTAVLHDVLEDTNLTVNDLLNSGVPRTVVDAVVTLTHCPENSYDEYIERVAANELARKVKLADLADNLANNERLPRTSEVAARINRYKRAIRRLTGADGEGDDPLTMARDRRSAADRSCRAPGLIIGRNQRDSTTVASG
jgi:hypothetical protein